MTLLDLEYIIGIGAVLVAIVLAILWDRNCGVNWKGEIK